MPSTGVFHYDLWCESRSLSPWATWLWTRDPMSILSSLASCAATRRLQDCDSRPPVLVRQRPGLPGRRLSARPDARVRQLRSADTRTLVVSRTRSSFGDRTFAAAGPQVWNRLPPICGLSYGQFRRSLKTFIFGQWGHAQCELFLTAPTRNICKLIVLTFLDSFQNKSGKPQPIRTKVGTHAQLKSRQRSQNFGRDRLSWGRNGGSIGRVPDAGFFICKQYQTTFRQLRNGHLSPNLALTRESVMKRRFWT